MEYQKFNGGHMSITKLVIFDLDGTLFRTETVDIKAINNALISNEFSPKSDDEILGIIGYTLKDAIKKLINVDENTIVEKLSRDIITFEQDLIESSGELYEGIIYLLDSLKESGYKLYIYSNGGKDYIEGITNKFSLYNYFDDIKYSQEGVTKSQAVDLLKSKYSVDMFVMIGDRSSDIEAASDNNGKLIGVTYGFGKEEVLAADFTADTPSEIKPVIDSIFEKYNHL
jgi:phosphoglycolate phosphatase